jgi:N-acetylneuraminic acid mutarotase
MLSQEDAGGGGPPANQRDLAAGTASPHSPEAQVRNAGRKVWSRIDFQSSSFPCPRSGAASVVHENKLLVYGGYGGAVRLDDLWSFDFDTLAWEQIAYTGVGPGARENNGVVVMDNVLYMFGGFNGFQWLGDLHGFDLKKKKWLRIEERGNAPTARFGYVSATFSRGVRKELILFAGYDGINWHNDMYAFNFVTKEWCVECAWVEEKEPTPPGGRSLRKQHGDIPTIRSCPSWVRHEDTLYVFGGYDGMRRMSDFYALDLKTSTWTSVRQLGTPPTARYFHASIMYKSQMIVYGGFSGTGRLSDVHSFSLETHTWTQLSFDDKTPQPTGRSSLVATVANDSLWIFGGFNGTDVLGDMWMLQFDRTPPCTLTDDLLTLVDNPALGDVVFLVEGREVHAVSALLAVRCEHFKALLYGGMRESSKKEPIVLADIDHATFVLILEFMHSDRLLRPLDLPQAVVLLIAAERFMLDRLKALCIDEILPCIAVDNVVRVLRMSNRHADTLKEICLDFIVENLEVVKKSPDFAELRMEPELLLEIVMRAK